jgi:hypothetical protein
MFARTATRRLFTVITGVDARSCPWGWNHSVAGPCGQEADKMAFVRPGPPRRQRRAHRTSIRMVQVDEDGLVFHGTVSRCAMRSGARRNDGRQIFGGPGGGLLICINSSRRQAAPA